MTRIAQIQSDFDRIALLPAACGVDHNARYHAYLLRHVPQPCRAALELGCGAGAFARALAQRCQTVVAIDLSANMIVAAREGSRDCHNIEFTQADAMEWDYGQERFDCIASIATLHHLPVDQLLPRLTRALQPGGTLLVLDLVHPEGVIDLVRHVVAGGLTVSARLLKSGRVRDPPEVRRAWDEHGKQDTYLTMRQVRRLCESHLPGAIIRQHLMWRYSIVWRKPL